MNSRKILEDLESMYNRGLIHVIGITHYRSAQVHDSILSCSRDDVQFLENRIPQEKRDNHVVLIFQVTFGTNGWPEGPYYILLGDLGAVIAKQIVWKEY